MRPPAGAFEDTTHDWEGGGVRGGSRAGGGAGGGRSGGCSEVAEGAQNARQGPWSDQTS